MIPPGIPGSGLSETAGFIRFFNLHMVTAPAKVKCLAEQGKLTNGAECALGASSRHGTAAPGHAGDVRLTRRRFRPVQRIDGDDADRARYAGADLAVVVLLLVAEEHVAMVDLALDGNDVDGADAAFAALAVRYHLEAAAVQRVQHRAVLRHHEFGAGI